MGKLASLIRSFRAAFVGLIMIVRSERNARIHLVVAVVVLVVGLILRLKPTELATVILAVLAVFLGEIFNTSVEKTLDLIELRYDPKIGAIKDMAAGGVLVASVAAVVIGLVIFGPHLEGLWAR